jgi:hypothetical protein
MQPTPHPICEETQTVALCALGNKVTISHRSDASMLSSKHLIAPEFAVPRWSTDFQLDVQDSVRGKEFQSAPSRSIFHRVLAKPGKLDVSC